jgi:hypothetical protein
MISVRDERLRRKKIEVEKALEKYGAAALEPGGVPDYDVLDYLINEIVGLERYGEMVFHRREEWPREFRLRAGKLAKDIQAASHHFGDELISLWLSLKARGVLDGKESES